MALRVVAVAAEADAEVAAETVSAAAAGQGLAEEPGSFDRHLSPAGRGNLHYA